METIYLSFLCVPYRLKTPTGPEAARSGLSACRGKIDHHLKQEIELQLKAEQLLLSLNTPPTFPNPEPQILESLDMLERLNSSLPICLSG